MVEVKAKAVLQELDISGLTENMADLWSTAR